MLSRIIEVCARNRFLVFTTVLLLTLAGIWSLKRQGMNALNVINGVKQKLREIAPSLPPRPADHDGIRPL